MPQGLTVITCLLSGRRPYAGTRRRRTQAGRAPGQPGSAPGPPGRKVAAARGRTIPDLVAPGLRVLFSGINPSLYSAATGYHFARPGNRFGLRCTSPGFTGPQLPAADQHLLLDLGLGITNVVARATARADELDAAELRAGGDILAALAGRLRVTWLAVLGVTAYRTAFARPGAVVGPQEEQLGGARVWVLPNPSGLNAHWSAAAGQRVRAAASRRGCLRRRPLRRGQPVRAQPGCDVSQPGRR